jgi:carbon-monoxide dehydrogenase small subunit
LMLVSGMIEADPQRSDETIIEALSSNLCRCTGYQGIIDAVRAALPDMRQLGR